MGDTGIDWLHCTFTDSAHSGPGSGPYLTETAATGGYTYWVSNTHRKIVYYRQVDDNVDANGHGTHCAGSAVGSLQSPGQPRCCVQRNTASFFCGLSKLNAAKRHHICLFCLLFAFLFFIISFRISSLFCLPLPLSSMPFLPSLLSPLCPILVFTPPPSSPRLGSHITGSPKAAATLVISQDNPTEILRGAAIFAFVTLA